MKVTIHSHFRDESWTGEIPQLDALAATQDRLDAIFRAFNRVTTADGVRLEEWGYRLPSLSVGDRVSFDGRTFTVEPVGFAEIYVPRCVVCGDKGCEFCPRVEATR